MKIQSPISFAMGLLLAVLGTWSFLATRISAKFVPVIVGLSLAYLGWRGGRKAHVLLGHVIVICGCFLITYGLYLLPHAKPDVAHVFGMPLFWGLFCLLGGVCAIYHGFCRCVSSGCGKSKSS